LARKQGVNEASFGPDDVAQGLTLIGLVGIIDPPRDEAVRAVAQACGANPLAVLVPCPRVVRRDGGLSGYRWGVERKRELLRRESVWSSRIEPA
jgi:alkylated DNA nucleotide flippase Atl1